MSERSENVEEIQAFFEGWEIYQTIISENYMVHREIEALIRDELYHLESSSPATLEIGCGDAHILSYIAEDLKLRSYKGIDLSGMALNHARNKLGLKIPKVELIQGDMFVETKSLKSDYDFIVAGYTIHHLDTKEKTQIFQNLKSHLSPQGTLFVYDLIRNERETNEDYLQRALSYFDLNWGKFTTEQQASIRRHVTDNDFSESWESWKAIGQKSGYTSQTLLYREPQKIFGAMRFKRS